MNWNELTYNWTSLDGLSIDEANTDRPTIISPTDLTESTSYRVALSVNDGYCTDHDTVNIVIQDNLCPVADAGETRRIAKFESTTITLDAGNSFDPDGVSVSYSYEITFNPTSLNPTIESAFNFGGIVSDVGNYWKWNPTLNDGEHKNG